jgi:hypothetical protein
MQVRKISVGVEYKSAMHYILGQHVCDGKYIIHLISYSDSKKGYSVFIENENSEVFLWKFFNANMPISVEYNIDF